MNIKVLLKTVPLKNYLIFSFALPLLLIGVIVVLHGFIPPQLPLFYGLPTGESQLTSSWGILTAPVTSIAISVVNLFIVSRVENVFYKKVLVISSFLIATLVTITILKIIFLVGLF